MKNKKDVFGHIPKFKVLNTTLSSMSSGANKLHELSVKSSESDISLLRDCISGKIMDDNKIEGMSEEMAERATNVLSEGRENVIKSNLNPIGDAYSAGKIRGYRDGYNKAVDDITANISKLCKIQKPAYPGSVKIYEIEE